MALFWSIVAAIAFCHAASESARSAVSGKISPRVLLTSPPSHPCWPRISPLVALSGPAPWAPNPGIRKGALGRVARKLVLLLAMWRQPQSRVMSCPVCRRGWQQEVRATLQDAGKAAGHQQPGPQIASPGLLVRFKINKPLPVSSARLRNGARVSMPSQGLIVNASLGNCALWPIHPAAYALEVLPMSPV